MKIEEEGRKSGYNQKRLRERLEHAGWLPNPLVIADDKLHLTLPLSDKLQEQIAAKLFKEINSLLPDSWDDLVLGNTIFSAYQPHYQAGRLIPPKDSPFAAGLSMDAMLYLFRDNLDQENFQPLLECISAYSLQIDDILNGYINGSNTHIDSRDIQIYAAYALHVFCPFMSLVNNPLANELKDKAYFILNPEEYNFTIAAMEAASGRRLSEDECTMLADEACETVAEIGGWESVLIRGFARDKSILEWAFKAGSNRSSDDTHGVKIALDEEALLTAKNYPDLLQAGLVMVKEKLLEQGVTHQDLTDDYLIEQMDKLLRNPESVAGLFKQIEFDIYRSQLMNNSTSRSAGHITEAIMHGVYEVKRIFLVDILEQYMKKIGARLVDNEQIESDTYAPKKANKVVKAKIIRNFLGHDMPFEIQIQLQTEYKIGEDNHHFYKLSKSFLNLVKADDREVALALESYAQYVMEKIMHPGLLPEKRKIEAREILNKFATQRGEAYLLNFMGTRVFARRKEEGLWSFLKRALGRLNVPLSKMGKLEFKIQYQQDELLYLAEENQKKAENEKRILPGDINYIEALFYNEGNLSYSYTTNQFLDLIYRGKLGNNELFLEWKIRLDAINTQLRTQKLAPNTVSDAVLAYNDLRDEAEIYLIAARRANEREVARMHNAKFYFSYTFAK